MYRRNASRMIKLRNSMMNEVITIVGSWGIEQAQIYVPLLLTATLNIAKEIPSAVQRGTSAHKEAKALKQSQFMNGLEQGKKQREAEMIQGMKKIGLSDEQIFLILREVSGEENTDDSAKPKRPFLKVLKTKKRGAD